ncbi:MAG: hypothetical protein ACLUOI_15135 [Eisenbergiella sp.]
MNPAGMTGHSCVIFHAVIKSGLFLCAGQSYSGQVKRGWTAEGNREKCGNIGMTHLSLAGIPPASGLSANGIWLSVRCPRKPAFTAGWGRWYCCCPRCSRRAICFP